MESSSHEVLDDHSSDEGSLVLESLCNPVLRPAPCCPRRPYCASNDETKNEAGPKVEQQDSNGRISSPSCLLSLRLYFSMLAVELNTDVESLVIVVDNAHIPLGDEYLLENEDLGNETFSRSLSAINTVSFPPPFLTMVKNDSHVSSSRWDSIEIPRGTRRSSHRPQLVNHQTESTDSGPLMPGRTCDDYEEETEEGHHHSIDMTMHQRFMERNLQSPVPMKKTQRRGRRRGPIVPPCRTTTTTTTTTTTVELCKPYHAPGPSSSLDSTSRWLRELPHRGDMNPMPPSPGGLLDNCRRSRASSRRRGDSVEELDNVVLSVTEDERPEQVVVPSFKEADSTTSEESWTAWFDMMSSMASARHDPGCDMNLVGDDDVGLTNETKETVLHEGIPFKCQIEESNGLKPTDSGHHVASWDELISMQRSSFLRSRRANPSSLVNQLMIIDKGLPSNPFQRATHSPASHFKREQTKRNDIDLLLGHVSPTYPFERDTCSLSASSHS